MDGRLETLGRIAAEVETWPVGGRGIVTVQGHTLNAERGPNGKAVFVDAQAARNKTSLFQRVIVHNVGNFFRR